jgi:hypothetical protein
MFRLVMDRIQNNASIVDDLAVDENIASANEVGLSIDDNGASAAERDPMPID